MLKNHHIIILLVLSNLLVYQFTTFYYHKYKYSTPVNNAKTDERFQPSPNSSERNRGTPFSIPEGEAVALPSIIVSDEEDAKVNRKIYGGAKDKKHLGGFTDIDLMGVSPAVWKFMIKYVGVKSVLDVGCGRGISTSWFDVHGVDALCAEGSHDAVTKTIIPSSETKIVEHDFSQGPWWPSKTYDAVWCVEFLEHVGRNFHLNYIPTFRKAAFIFATHSTWGGWHHVEVHEHDWWVAKMQSYGFVYSEFFTKKVRSIASAEKSEGIKSPKENENYNAQHVWLTMMVFINPAVASLPEHQHLFAEGGCYVDTKEGVIITRDCDGVKDKVESVLPKEYVSLEITDEMDKEWEELVRKNIPPSEG